MNDQSYAILQQILITPGIPGAALGCYYFISRLSWECFRPPRGKVPGRICDARRFPEGRFYSPRGLIPKNPLTGSRGSFRANLQTCER
jgi:hypothetical protein